MPQGAFLLVSLSGACEETMYDASGSVSAGESAYEQIVERDFDN
jgi:hypothetical protein